MLLFTSDRGTQVSLENAKQAVQAARAAVDAMASGLAARVQEGGKLSRDRLDAIQPEAFNFARALADVENAEAAIRYAESLGSAYESDLASVFLT